jgi:hypothetical protein
MEKKKPTLMAGWLLWLLIAGSSWAGVDIKVNADTDTTTQNEPSITINRHFVGDPLNVVVAYNDIGKTLGISYSADSGKNWADVQLPYVWQITGDPSVASDINGNVYACFLSYEGTWFYGKSGIFVCQSIDGGRTWLSPVAADSLVWTGGSPVTFADKCMMTVDTNSASPYVNNVYVAWQRDGTNGQSSDIYFARSTNGGVSFSAPIQINDNPPQTAYAEGAFPFVGADGDVYVCWYDAYFRGHEPGSLYVDKSTNGGATFGTDIKVANILTPPLYTFGNTGFKAKSFASAAGDPSDPEKLYVTYISDPDGYFDRRVDNGKPPVVPSGGSMSDRPTINRNGNYVYMAWEDYRNPGTSDIYFNRSTDNGQSWQVPDIGPLDNGDIPGGSASNEVKLSSSGNYVYAVWQDCRLPAGVHIYFNSSWDNGQTWQLDQHIDGSATATSTYPSIASIGSYVYVAWQDDRAGTGNDDIYFTRSTDSGKSWMAPVRIDLGDGAGANASAYPRLACQGSHVYCMWKDMRNGGTYLPYFNYSSNNGVTWLASSTQLSQGSGYWSQMPLQGGIECTGSYVYACWWDDRDATGLYQVFFNRSTNNGVSWGTNVRISDSTGNLCLNPSMDIQGNYVYIGWEDYRLSGFSEIFFDYSSDNGATWQSPDIGPLDVGGIAMPAAVPQIKADGNYVYAAWQDSRRLGGLRDIYFARSTNNGATWQSDVRINWGTQPFGLLLQSYPMMVAGNGYVTVAWLDPRYFGPPNIYANNSTDNGATWLSGLDEADVYCVRSTDGGTTWQAPVTVNDDGTTYAQVLPWVVVKNNGMVDISYYNFRTTPLNANVPGAQVRMAVSSNGGSSFGPSFALQDTVVTPVTQWVGEYNGMAVLDSFVYTVFTDNEQDTNSNIYIDRSVNPTGCCNTDGIRGDANYDFALNVGDVTYLTAYLKQKPPGSPAPPCFEEGDANGDGSINVADVTYLSAYFKQKPPGSPAPPACP